MIKPKKNVYKSFEQLRSELFPKLIEQEKLNKVKENPEKFGAYLADKSIDRMLANEENSTTC